ncbi:MAG: glycosyltransferase family 4 protein [Chloroflexi bacterium]|nr:glycosyltransferase family 4 protein [Chloroflexota bacterium]
MRVLIAVHHFPPRYTGGAEWRAYRTAAALQARGHKVRVVCVERIDAGPAEGVGWEDEVYDGVVVRRLSFNLAAAPDPFRYEYDNPWIGDHMQALFDEYRPDVFHLISGYLMSGRVLWVAHQYGIPTAVTLTDFWFLCPRISMLRSDGRICALPVDATACARCLAEEKRRYRIPGHIAPGLVNAVLRLEKTQIRNVEARAHFLHDVLGHVDAVISPSLFLRAVFVDVGVDPKRVIFSRQGHDFPDVAREAQVVEPRTALRVGYAGQIAWHKGVHVLLEAARQLPDAPLSVRVYGDPTPFPKYTASLQRILERDERLDLGGVYRREEVSRVMGGLDVIVVPSLWYENSPNAILEAFAHRVPVIASNLGGMAELVRDGENGLLFEPGDAGDLAQRLRQVVDDPDLLPMLRAGIGPVRSVAEEIDELEGIYRSVTADSHSE